MSGGDDDDDEFPDDLPTIRLSERRSVELYYLHQAFPNTPIFPGAVIDWPDWFIRDYSIVARVKKAIDAEKRWREKQERAAKSKLKRDRE